MTTVTGRAPVHVGHHQELPPELQALWGQFSYPGLGRRQKIDQEVAALPHPPIGVLIEARS